MTPAIRRALVVFPLGLILWGCSHSTKSTVQTASSEREEASPPSPVHMTLVRQESPPELPTYPSVDFEELSEHIQNKSAVIVDARSAKSFSGGHVRGAINVPAGEKEAYTEQYLRQLDHDRLIIIYCSNPTCHASDMLYEYLASQGFTNMRLFVPGWQRLASAKELR
ncbi:MAG TPA: rhodanese-like domain-containing protein [Phycisphaerae bacterium]|nr:rhodanese-like domain-containing protein [Phycisphaerae bacterium]